MSVYISIDLIFCTGSGTSSINDNVKDTNCSQVINTNNGNAIQFSNSNIHHENPPGNITCKRFCNSMK